MPAFFGQVEFPTQHISLKATPEFALATSFGFILIFTAIIVTGIYLGRYFAAEVCVCQNSQSVVGSTHRFFKQNCWLESAPDHLHLALAESFSKAAETADKPTTPTKLLHWWPRPCSPLRQPLTNHRILSPVGKI